MNEAETWQTDSEWIKKEMGANITKHRIRKVSFKHNGKVLTAEVPCARVSGHCVRCHSVDFDEFEGARIRTVPSRIRGGRRSVGC